MHLSYIFPLRIMNHFFHFKPLSSRRSITPCFSLIVKLLLLSLSSSFSKILEKDGVLPFFYSFYFLKSRYSWYSLSLARFEAISFPFSMLNQNLFSSTTSSSIREDPLPWEYIPTKFIVYILELGSLKDSFFPFLYKKLKLNGAKWVCHLANICLET